MKTKRTGVRRRIWRRQTKLKRRSITFLHILTGQLYSAFASTAISTATSHSNQTATHQASSVINSSQQVQILFIFASFRWYCEFLLILDWIFSFIQQQSSAENGAVRQSNIQNNNTSSSNNVVTSQHQTQGLLTSVTSGSSVSSALDSHAIFTSITNNNLTTTSTTINNSITNSVSPTNSIVSSMKWFFIYQHPNEFRIAWKDAGLSVHFYDQVQLVDYNNSIFSSSF